MIDLTKSMDGITHVKLGVVAKELQWKPLEENIVFSLLNIVFLPIVYVTSVSIQWIQSVAFPWTYFKDLVGKIFYKTLTLPSYQDKEKCYINAI